MGIKAELVTQLEGFGNRAQKRVAEHFRSMGLVRSAFGMVASAYIYDWFTDLTSDYPQYTFGPINNISIATSENTLSFGSSSGFPVVYFLDDNGNILQSRDGTYTPEMIYPHDNSSHFGTGYLGGMIGDQKGRLLFAGKRYLGAFDPTANPTSHTVTLTNGAKTCVRTAGDNFVSGNARQFIVLQSGGNYYFYRISSYTDANNVTLNSNFALTTGSYNITIYTGWVDRFKDFGTDLSNSTEDGYDRYIACETYEDTVLFGRKNNICTLNTLTDTITTDASPAFNLPDGFEILSIHKGANGILIGCNFQGKGVLVLWDNYSDRAIAPWIPLNDRLISLCKNNGNWIVITAREFFETNGYSLTPLADKVLDMDIDPLASQNLPNTSYVIEKELYFITDFSLHGKRRAGLHRMNLDTKLIEYIPRTDMEQHEDRVRTLAYGGANNNLFVGQSDAISYVQNNAQSTNATIISNAVGAGDNIKHAEAVKLNLGISSSYYTLNDTPFSYTAVVKICPLKNQTFQYGLVKTTQTVANQIVVNETTYGVAEVGDEIEFVMGNNAGYSRNILSKSGSGATVTYTLDRDLPALSTANDYFMRTKFRLVTAKEFVNVTEIDPELLFFDIKNKVKGKQFLLKVDIEDATIPIEIRPFYFIYDDLGIL